MRALVAVAMLCGLARADRLYAPDSRVVDVPAASTQAAIGERGYKRIPTVEMRTPKGDMVYVDEDAVAALEADGYWRMTRSEISNEMERRSIAVDEKYAAEERREEIVKWVAIVGVPLLLVVLIWLGRRYER